MHIALSQWVRPYALTFCIAIGLLLVAIQLGQRTNFASWVLFWGLATLAMYTLYILGAMLFGVGLYIWYKRRTMGLIKGLAPVAGVGVGVLISFASWIPILIRQSSWAPQALWWVPPPHLRLLLETVDQFLFSLEGRRWPLPLVIVVICSLIVLLLLGIYRAAKKRRLSLSLLTTLFPLAMIWSASYIRPIFLARHVSFALPGVILLLAEGLTYWAPSIRRIAFIGLVLVGLVAQVTAPIGQDIIIPWSEVASWMEIHAEAGDMIVFSPPFQQTAFEIKYQGPALETRGIGEYQAYVQQPDAIFDVRIPARQLQAWADDRLYFWLLEDRRWPTEWDALRWEYEAIAEARFPGLTIYRFVRQSPTEN